MHATTHQLDAHEVVLALPNLDLVDVTLDATAHGFDDAAEEKLDLLGLTEAGHALSNSVHVGDVDTLELIQREGVRGARLVGLISVDQVALQVSRVVGAAGGEGGVHCEDE